MPSVAFNAADGYGGDYSAQGTVADGTSPGVAMPGAALAFRTYPPPQTHSLEPAAGPLHGGTLLTLCGVGFDAFGELPSRPTIKVALPYYKLRRRPTQCPS